MAIIAVFGLVAVMTLIESFVISKLWLWHVVSQFGLHPLSLPVAFGLSCLWNSFSYSPSVARANTTLGEQFINGVGTLLVLFVMGWIAHLLT